MRISLFIGTVYLLLSALGYFYYRANLPFGKSTCFALFYGLFSLNAVLSRTLSPLLPLGLVKASAWLEGLWVAFSYYTLLFALLHLIMWLGVKLAGLLALTSPSKTNPISAFSSLIPRLAALSLVCSLALVGWGSYRAFHPALRTESITTTKLPANTSYKIAFITDVHLGRILGRSYAENLVERLNALEPDLVLIGGDLIDEKIAYVTEQNSLESLHNIKAKLGTYLAFGNHEFIDNPKEWQQLVEAQNIVVLQDKSVILEDKLKVTGLKDFSRNRSTATLAAESQGNANYYNILIDHQPRKMEAAAANGYDLYLSGHTHTGQLFPNRQITKRMYQLDYGRSACAQLTAITSSGYGFWGPPVRTEAAPEIVLIELSGK